MKHLILTVITFTAVNILIAVVSFLINLEGRGLMTWEDYRSEIERARNVFLLFCRYELILLLALGGFGLIMGLVSIFW